MLHSTAIYLGIVIYVSHDCMLIILLLLLLYLLLLDHFIMCTFG